jgi:hypothetical protein
MPSLGNLHMVLGGAVEVIYGHTAQADYKPHKLGYSPYT